jgi:subtilisin family serine protease
VAVIDSGIEAGHPAVGQVAGAIALEPGEDDADDPVLTEGPHEDLTGHGTASAAIIRIAAPDCALYSVRVLGRTLRGKASVFAAGLRWAINNGMHVVNMSLGVVDRRTAPAFQVLADEAYFRRVILVSAMNNLPVPSYPSQYPAVLSVAAHEGTDPFRFDYNPTPPAEFGAPGIDIEAAWLNGTTVKVTGNSFAAPHISGLVARLLSAHPGLTPFQVKTVLHDLAANARLE